MSEAELIQLNKDKNCTLYTIQFLTEDKGNTCVSITDSKMMLYTMMI
jgi:hypothetical protein